MSDWKIPEFWDPEGPEVPDLDDPEVRDAYLRQFFKDDMADIASFILRHPLVSILYFTLFGLFFLFAVAAVITGEGLSLGTALRMTALTIPLLLWARGRLTNYVSIRVYRLSRPNMRRSVWAEYLGKELIYTFIWGAISWLIATRWPLG